MSANDNDEAMPIICPGCDRTGWVGAHDGGLVISAGFGLDEERVPICTSCHEPAGLRLPAVDPADYGVGPGAPRDALFERHQAVRALGAAFPAEVGPPLRWRR